MKTCRLCHRTKAPSEFPKNRRQCKSCCNQRQRERYGTPEGKAARKEANARWYGKVKNTSYYEAVRKEWQDNNPDKIKAARLARYAGNTETERAKNRAKLRRLRAANPGHFRAYACQRKGSQAAFIETLKSQPCSDCGRVLPVVAMDFDHVRGIKRRPIANMVGQYSREQIELEIAKCDLVCACCHRVRTRKRGSPQHPSTRRQWLDSLKRRPCVDCGGVFSPEAMDFDHVRGGKVAGVAQTYGWKRERVLAELLKCDLVCACCHRVRTHEHRSTTP
jgi:hypothetical protein